MSSTSQRTPNCLRDLVVSCRQKVSGSVDSKQDCANLLKAALRCNEGVAGYFYQGFLSRNKSDPKTNREKLKKDLLGVLEHLKQIHATDPEFPRPKEFIVQKMCVVQQGVTFFAQDTFNIVRLKLFLMVECCLSFVRSVTFLELAGQRPDEEAKRQINLLVRQDLFQADAKTMATFWYQASKFNQRVLETAGVAFVGQNFVGE